MSEVLNANPTIRNASDLPSRRRQLSSQTSSKSPLGLFASTVPASAYAPDPFSPTTSDPDNPDLADDSVDPIDEQEIYGIASLFFLPKHNSLSACLNPFATHPSEIYFVPNLSN